MGSTTSYCSWITHLDEAYAYQDKTGGRCVPLFDALRQLFDETVQPDEAAILITSFVMSNADFLAVYYEVISIIVSSALKLSDEQDLGKLARLVLALSRLPDVRNESTETLHLSFNHKTLIVGSGRVIEVNGGKLWADLPQFETELGDSMYGVTGYINDGEAEHIAEQQWTSHNTFAAFLYQGNSASPCDFGFLSLYAFRTIVYSLEYDPTTVKGIDSLHNLRSACRWILIAGEELWTETMQSRCSASAGPMRVCEEGYEDDHGRNSVTVRRWLAWARRLDDLAAGNIIEDELNELARAAAGRIKDLEKYWVFDDVEAETEERATVSEPEVK
ncbi:hypothetical protein E4T42_01588 [Aureobasidium subglaciale]|nr:hypothetical protein E4T42_01588 [Aureobasidium subglaciale]